MQCQQTQLVVFATKVHHAQIGEDETDLHIVHAVTTRQALGVVADRRNHINFVFADKHIFAVVGHKERVGVADGVARKTARAQHLHFGLVVVVTDHADVGLTVLVNLRWANHGVALATPNIVKNAGKTHPAFTRQIVRRACRQGHRLRQHPSFRVRHHQISVNRFHAQRCSQARHNADTCGQHFAVVFPSLRRRANDAVD